MLLEADVSTAPPQQCMKRIWELFCLRYRRQAAQAANQRTEGRGVLIDLTVDRYSEGILPVVVCYGAATVWYT